MATVSFQETDTAVACALAAYGSGLSLTTGTSTAEQASQGGTAGTATNSPSLQKSASNAIACGFECIVPSGATWAAGTWTIRLDVTTANSNLTWTECYVVRISSACGTQATIGSNTSVGISLSTTGIKSTTVSGAVQTPSAGDKVYVLLAFTNGQTHNTQSFSYIADQLIDSPFTASTVNTKSLAAVGAAFNGSTVKQTNIPLSGNSSALNGSLIKKTLIALAATGTAFSATIVESLVQLISFAATSTAFSGSLAKKALVFLAAASASFSGAIVKKTLAVINAVSAALNGAVAKLTKTTMAAISSAFNGSLSAAVVFLQSIAGVAAAMNGAIVKQINKNLIAISSSFSGSLVKLIKIVLAAASSAFSGSINKKILITLQAVSAAFSGVPALIYKASANLNAISSAFSAILNAALTGGQTFFQNLAASMASLFGSLAQSLTAAIKQSTILDKIPIENIKILLKLNPSTQTFPINAYPDFPAGIPRSALQSTLDNNPVPPSAEGTANDEISGYDGWLTSHE